MDDYYNKFITFYLDTSPKYVFYTKLVPGSIKVTIVEAGINQEGFNGHCFRKDEAQSAAAAGTSGDEIKTLGRWKSDAYNGHDDVHRLKLAKIVINKLRSTPRA